MKKFRVSCSEMVYYDIEIIAEKESDVESIVLESEMSEFVVTDSDRFEINSILYLSNESKREQ
jgi:hypothetical protein